MPGGDRYSLTELADLAGVTPRTVRYYLAQGLLPAVGQTGPGSKYDGAHLARLRLIRRLQDDHLPLAEIRRRIGDLTDDEIRELAGDMAPEPPRESALDYLRAVLHGPALARPRRTLDVGIHVQPPPRAQGERAGLIPVAAAPSISPGLAEGEVKPHPAPPAPASAAPSSPEPQPLERSQWDRLAFSPDIELHIRRPLGRVQQKQVDRLVTIARELLEEDQP
jgi:DNA-binding transcriptional MerR regulator